MKATIDFDENLYRRLKVEAARRGTTIRELVAQGVQRVLAEPVTTMAADQVPPWLGSLREYAKNAKGKHDLASMRASVARARWGEKG
jgi:hypothetical protein